MTQAAPVGHAIAFSHRRWVMHRTMQSRPTGHTTGAEDATTMMHAPVGAQLLHTVGQLPDAASFAASAVGAPSELASTAASPPLLVVPLLPPLLLVSPLSKTLDAASGVVCSPYDGQAASAADAAITRPITPSRRSITRPTHGRTR